jgi:hypothetical protein
MIRDPIFVGLLKNQPIGTVGTMDHGIWDGSSHVEVRMTNKTIMGSAEFSSNS